jgi:hypothetical protein
MTCSLVANLVMLFMSPSCGSYLRKWASVSLLIQRNRPRCSFSDRPKRPWNEQLPNELRT